jgi:hypothetical protein
MGSGLRIAIIGAIARYMACQLQLRPRRLVRRLDSRPATPHACGDTESASAMRMTIGVPITATLTWVTATTTLATGMVRRMPVMVAAAAAGLPRMVMGTLLGMLMRDQPSVSASALAAGAVAGATIATGEQFSDQMAPGKPEPSFWYLCFTAQMERAPGATINPGPRFRRDQSSDQLKLVNTLLVRSNFMNSRWEQTCKS